MGWCWSFASSSIMFSILNTNHLHLLWLGWSGSNMSFLTAHCYSLHYLQYKLIAFCPEMLEVFHAVEKLGTIVAFSASPIHSGGLCTDALRLLVYSLKWCQCWKALSLPGFMHALWKRLTLWHNCYSQPYHVIQTFKRCWEPLHW